MYFIVYGDPKIEKEDLHDNGIHLHLCLPSRRHPPVR